MRKKVDIVVIALSSPILIGVYKDNKLIDSVETDEKSSEALPLIFEDLLAKYEIKNLFYANGPGSFMAIKVSYIFLKSLSILNNVPLYARDAFYFNKNQPIKAIAKLYFVKLTTKIETQRLENVPICSFKLHDVLEYDEFTKESTPIYGIGAVG